MSIVFGVCSLADVCDVTSLGWATGASLNPPGWGPPSGKKAEPAPHCPKQQQSRVKSGTEILKPWKQGAS